MSKKCKCRDNREQRRCPNVTPLTLAIASNTDFLSPKLRRVAIFSRNNSNFPTAGVLLFRGNTLGNAVSLAANSQTVV